jgi:murein DD-endopeptidase / murein LD-carboxypeptidase
MEGDLLFFNTLGNGVSHVAIYLGNNRFIHSTVSKGVMVNSLFDSYYVKRFVGAGRIDKKQIVASN